MPHTQSRSLDLDQALEQYDSKFRFVLLASNRAEQLVRGARPKLEGISKKPTRVAMEELKGGLVPWSYGAAPAPELPEGAEPGVAAGEGGASS
ncbi:MAG TPA: DNA-directed RNA polymerase subunit omega [Thermoanaerobaculia bacterium]|nr:DNA-directed RNA polymerase subunit omega [Thermoanaerobaculia bacterium]